MSLTQAPAVPPTLLGLRLRSGVASVALDIAKSHRWSNWTISVYDLIISDLCLWFLFIDFQHFLQVPWALGLYVKDLVPHGTRPGYNDTAFFVYFCI